MTSGFYLLIDTGLVLTDDYRIEVPDLYLAENEIMISSGDSGLRDCKGWKATRTLLQYDKYAFMWGQAQSISSCGANKPTFGNKSRSKPGIAVSAVG